MGSQQLAFFDNAAAQAAPAAQRDANTPVDFIPPGKLRCIITGKLRSDTPEENVRQRIARSLLDDYGYPRETIAVEFTIQIGSQRKRVDLAIFPAGAERTQQHIDLIVEAKREEVRPSDKDNGVDQLLSYLAACPNARFGLWFGSEMQVWEQRLEEDEAGRKTRQAVPAADIPRFGAERPRPLTFTDLAPARDELISVFRRAHNYIYGNQGLQKEPAFEELLKLIFCKVYDEDTTEGELRFFISNEERRSELGQHRLRRTMEGLFDAVKKQYNYIFPRQDTLRLENHVLAYVVSEMQRFSLLMTDADVKGMAYEQLVGANLRGDRGEFFTPRNVCQMAARLAFATYPESEWEGLTVCDPACGTGGFLVAAMDVLRGRVEERLRQRLARSPLPADELRIRMEANHRLREMVQRQLVGIDFNPSLVRAAQMNLVMHGDGSTNVFHMNSLRRPGEWAASSQARDKVQLGSFDIVVTNPPFGANIRIDDSHTLDQYELYRTDLPPGSTRGPMPPEQLFIERCLQLLKPGGRLAIVLPDSILSNPGLTFIRRWLLQKTRVIASIDLPGETFQPYTGVQTSVLLLQKKSVRQLDHERISGRPLVYDVFMARPRAIGHDRRGEPLYLRTPDGKVVEYERERQVYRRGADGELTVERRSYLERMRHDELPLVERAFESWVRQPAQWNWFTEDDNTAYAAHVVNG